MEQWMNDILEQKTQLLYQLKECGYFEQVENAGVLLVDCLKKGNKILSAGNGGSAADAQHFSGELVGRFLKERAPLPAITLTVDPTVMTAIANDYGYENTLARQVEGLGNEEDIAFLISTSGNSENLIRAAKAAREKKLQVIGLLGKDGGALREWCDIALVVPETDTPRIQELHTFTVHLLCEMIEKECF